MMAGIKPKNTKPEIILRKALHRMGFRYGLHARDLPGKPDMVFRSRKAVIFVHGCFWHGHDCPYFKMPTTRPEFWSAKIEANRKRDASVSEKLKATGWRQLNVWECALRGKNAGSAEMVTKLAADWLRSEDMTGEIRG